jgi:hypothetical protein
VARGENYCPWCEEVHDTPVANWSGLEFGWGGPLRAGSRESDVLVTGNRVTTDTDPPIHYRRRLRMCNDNSAFATVEVDETLLDELVHLRETVRALDASLLNIQNATRRALKHRFRHR